MDVHTSALATVWFFILLFLVSTALALEGTSLGVGILSLFARDRKQREDLMGSISPLWHANITWLVVAGGILFGAFPLFYAMLLSTLYLPAMLMLMGLICRSVSLELYADAEHKDRWAKAFGWGSLAAALGLGLGLGSALSGLGDGGGMAGGDFRWLSPLALAVCAMLLVLALLVACLFLVAKTEASTQAQARRWALRLFPTLLLFGGLVDVWMISSHPFLLSRLLDWPWMLVTLLPVLLAIVVYVYAWLKLLNGEERFLFPLGLALTYLLCLAYGASLYPWLIPETLTVGQAAGQELTLKAFLWIAGLLMPVLVVYNIYLYRIFKGKVGREGYGLYEH